VSTPHRHGRRRPERRPPRSRPRLSRELIAETALEIADREGFEAVSMRRIAGELSSGTMSLYHYVRTKDELIALMDDAIMGEVLVPDGEMPDHWRDAIAAIARRSKDAFVRHPWSFESLQGAAVGPNGTRHFEQSLAAVSSLDAPIEERLRVVTLVDDYVFGYVVRTVGPHGQAPTKEEIDDALADFEDILSTEEFPHLTGMIRPGEDVRTTWDRVIAIIEDESRFEYGLKLLLDGIEADVARRGGG
jgi:AcrR family transcriptional regulator